MELKQNDFVFHEQEKGEEFYIILSGTVDCIKLHDNGTKKGFIKVRTL